MFFGLLSIQLTSQVFIIQTNPSAIKPSNAAMTVFACISLIDLAVVYPLQDEGLSMLLPILSIPRLVLPAHGVPVVIAYISYFHLIPARGLIINLVRTPAGQTRTLTEDLSKSCGHMV